MEFVRIALLTIVYVALTVAMSAFARADEVSQGSFLIDQVTYQNHQMRTGVYLEQGEMKGCVLFLEGLGDSIRNHATLFAALSQAGYRTVSFDYYGQGGSTGSMNETRLESSFSRYSEIKTQAKTMWKHFSSNVIHGHSCAQSPKVVIGWSTGGLAAYELAHERWAKGVVLLAPGIAPNFAVGEAASQGVSRLWHVEQLSFWPWRFSFSNVISARSLTRDRGSDGGDPHVDLPRPSTPAMVPLFAINLVYSARNARRFNIDRSVKGLVFLSGREDSYVDREKTKKVLKKHAPHFQVKAYDGALHELDNELPAVREDLFARTIRFLNTIH